MKSQLLILYILFLSNTLFAQNISRPFSTLFTYDGNLLYKNVEISKLHKISINIHGGWIYNTGFGRLAVGIPTILGTVFSYGYNHKYILK